jgi:hypothetical protein
VGCLRALKEYVIQIKGQLKNKNKNSAAHVISWAYSTIYAFPGKSNPARQSL